MIISNSSQDRPVAGFQFRQRLLPGCKAILTSRRRIGSGSEEIILEKLDQDAALARTSEAERIALYSQTAGKPLLLRWGGWKRPAPAPLWVCSDKGSTVWCCGITLSHIKDDDSYAFP